MLRSAVLDFAFIFIKRYFSRSANVCAMMKVGATQDEF